MTRGGLMMPAGQAVIDLAKKSGRWESLVDVENGVIPDDLQKAFGKNKKAFENFQRFSPSARKIMLQWVQFAKRPETRQQRIEKIVEKAEENVKAYP